MLFPQGKVRKALEKVEVQLLRDEDLRKFKVDELVHIRSKIKSVYKIKSAYIHLNKHSEGRQRIDQPKKRQPKKCCGIGRSLPPEENKDEDEDSRLTLIINRQLKLELDCRLASLNPTVDKIQGAVGCRATLCILIKMN